MDFIEFDFNKRDMSIPQAINKAFQKAGRWYDLTSVEINQYPSKCGLLYYCKCGIKKKGVGSLIQGNTQQECSPAPQQ